MLHRLILLIFSCSISLLIARDAVIITPVCDGIIHSLDSNRNNIHELYANLPIVPTEQQPLTRSYQFLFNMIVDITEETSEEVKARAYNIFYGIDPATQEKYQSFWLLKKDIKYLDELAQDCKAAIPQPLTLERWHDEQVIVLTQPWHSAITNTHYSVATRFVRLPELDNHNFFGITIYDHDKNQTIIDLVPKSCGIIEGSIPVEHRREALIALIKHWIEQYGNQTKIPYVLGGASLLYPFLDHNCHIGFDCSSLIFRAAQILSIPIATKTSFIMEQCLEKLGPDEMPQAGDIIWFPGHVIIIGNNNELIQSSGYSGGHGCLHARPMSEYFKDITSIEELVKVYRAQQPVTILHKNGTMLTTIPSIKILKLPIFP